MADNRQEGVRLDEIVRFGVATMVVIAGVSLLLWAILRPRTAKLSTFLATAVLAGFSLPPISAALARAGLTSGPSAGLAVFLLLVALACAARFGDRPRLYTFLLLFATMRLAIPVSGLVTGPDLIGALRPGADQGSLAIAWPLESNDVWSGQAVRRPNIYWFSVDSYPSSQALKTYFQIDNDGFERDLERVGFIVAKESYANYNKTKVSLATSLNMAYMFKKGDAYADTSGGVRRWLPGRSRSGLSAALAGDNRAVGWLRQVGYRYIHHDSGRWESLQCRGFEDVCLQVQGGGLSETRRALARILPWAPIAESLDLPPLPGYGPSDASGPAQGTEIPEVSQILVAEQERPPFFAFAHFAGLHKPYLHDADCNLRDVKGPTEFESELRCLNKQLLALFDIVLREDPEAIIVLAGDHGVRLTDSSILIHEMNSMQIREHLAVLGALRLPPSCARWIEPRTTPVNFLRIVFACLGDEEPRLLSNQHYLVSTSIIKADFGAMRQVDSALR